MTDIIEKINRHPFITLLIYCAFLNGVLLLFPFAAKYTVFALFALYTGGVLISRRGKLRSGDIIGIAVVFGIALRSLYIMYTSVDVRQHDVSLFGIKAWKRNYYHSGYIEYILNNGAFPEMHPETFNQFYHPPLHHTLCAIRLKISSLFGIEYGAACESLQILTLFYASSASILGIKTVKALGFSDKASLFPALLLSLHPTLIIMSGSVNNDILSIALAFAAFYTAVKWYKKQSLGLILLCALFMGSAMMAKLSAALVAPAIAVIFISVMLDRIKNKSGVGNIFSQFFGFGAVCVPLGLWWQVKNALFYDMPLGYVPYVPETSQLLTDRTVFERLFGFDAESFTRIFVAWKNAYDSSFSEYNMFTGLFKTSVFGEWPLFYSKEGVTAVSAVGTAVSHVLFWSAVVLAVILTVSALYMILKKSFIFNKTVTLSLFVLCVTVLYSYISFCFGYPVTCTQNFRYCVPLLLAGSVFCAKAFEIFENKKIFKYTLSVVVSVLCISSALVFILLKAM